MVKPQETKVNVDRAHFSARLKSLFFPLTLDDLEPGLQKLGFELVPELGSARVMTLAPGVRLNPSGRLARNSETDCFFNMVAERGILAMEAPNIEVAVRSFELLQEWILQVTEVDLASETRFFEFILEATVQVGSERNPLTAANRAFQDSVLMKNLGEVLGVPVFNYGVRLVGHEQSPADDEWLELRIEPSVARPEVVYLVNMVYRHENREAVAKQALQSLETAVNVIAAIEK